MRPENEIVADMARALEEIEEGSSDEDDADKDVLADVAAGGTPGRGGGGAPPAPAPPPKNRFRGKNRDMKLYTCPIPHADPESCKQHRKFCENTNPL
jgi:hypothetical protein